MFTRTFVQVVIPYIREYTSRKDILFKSHILTYSNALIFCYNLMQSFLDSEASQCFLNAKLKGYYSRTIKVFDF